MGTGVLGKLSFVIGSIELNLLEDSLAESTDDSHCIDGIVHSDGDRGVAHSFGSGLFGAVDREKFGAAVLHSDSVGQNYSIGSTGH